MRTLMWLLCGGLLLAAVGGCATQSAAVLTPAAVRDAPEDYLVLAVNNEPQRYARAGSTARSYGGKSHYLESAEARRTLRAIAAEYQLQAVSGWPIPELALHCAIFKTRGASRSAVLDQLRHDSRIAIAQPLQSFTTSTAAASDYNDPYASLQNNLTQMGVREAHQWSRGKDIRIAVIDTGVDATHPELQGRVAGQRNFVDRNRAQFVADRHGTAIAGVIAANANNGIGIVGVAPQAKIFGLKACWQLKPDRDAAACNSFTLAQALASAIALRVHVINLSLVGPADPLLSALIRRAQQAGIIVVGAASSANEFPAQLSKVIGVSSDHDRDGAALISNTLHAPGRDVMTLAPGGRYDFSSGNSIATAEVSGAIALLLAGADSRLSADSESLHRRLMQASAQTPSLNVCLALNQQMKQARCSGQSQPPSENDSATASAEQGR